MHNGLKRGLRVWRWRRNHSLRRGTTRSRTSSVIRGNNSFRPQTPCFATDAYEKGYRTAKEAVEEDHPAAQDKKERQERARLREHVGHLRNKMVRLPGLIKGLKPERKAATMAAPPYKHKAEHDGVDWEYLSATATNIVRGWSNVRKQHVHFRCGQQAPI